MTPFIEIMNIPGIKKNIKRNSILNSKKQGKNLSIT